MALFKTQAKAGKHRLASKEGRNWSENENRGENYEYIPLCSNYQNKCSNEEV